MSPRPALVLSGKELALVESADMCRLATVSRSGWPHVVPVGYIYSRGRFYVPSDPRSRKVSNLKSSPRATIVIDDGRASGVMLECSARLLAGRAASRWIGVMESKGWQSGGSSVIELAPRRAASWFKGQAGGPETGSGERARPRSVLKSVLNARGRGDLRSD